MMHTDKIRPARNGKRIGGKRTAQALHLVVTRLPRDHALTGKRCQQRMVFGLDRCERTQQCKIILVTFSKAEAVIQTDPCGGDPLLSYKRGSILKKGAYIGAHPVRVFGSYVCIRAARVH